MDEAWRNFSKNCVNSYNAIQTLKVNGLMDEKKKEVYEHNLLAEIITIMKSEVDDWGKDGVIDD